MSDELGPIGEDEAHEIIQGAEDFLNSRDLLEDEKPLSFRFPRGVTYTPEYRPDNINSGIDLQDTSDHSPSTMGDDIVDHILNKFDNISYSRVGIQEFIVQLQNEQLAKDSEYRMKLLQGRTALPNIHDIYLIVEADILSSIESGKPLSKRHVQVLELLGTIILELESQTIE